MTVEGARKWLILASLLVTVTVFVFFLIAPVTGFPFTFDQSLRLLEIVLPVFLAYLSSAASFVFSSSSAVDDLVFRRAKSSLVSLLIKGPIMVFAVAMAAIIFAFGFSNRPAAPAGSGISINQLAAGISIILGMLVVTTNVAVNYLFGGGAHVARKRDLHDSSNPSHGDELR